MTRAAALDFLDGALVPRLCALTWLGPGITGDGSADARVVIASRLEVDLAFVEEGPSAPAAIPLLHDADVAAAWVIDGPFGLASAREGWSALARAVVVGEDDAIERVCSSLGALVVSVREAVAAGADAVVIADDVASDSGWLYPEGAVRRVLATCVAEAVATAREAGMRALLHSDGDIAALYADAADAGFSGVHIATGDGLKDAAAARLARSAGLAVVGGLAARDLEGGACGVAPEIERLHASGEIMLSDDGGLVSAHAIEALEKTFAAARSSGSERGR